MRKIKKSAIALVVLLALVFTACDTMEGIIDEVRVNGIDAFRGDDEKEIISYSYSERSFEEMIHEFATDVVIAQYVGHKPFGELKTLIEYEFIVLDRVLGNAPDRIFIYTEVDDSGHNRDALKIPGGFTDARYLLPIRQMGSLFGYTHEDGYTFLHGIVVNLDDVSRSTMIGEPLNDHIDGLNLARSRVTGNTVISYVRQLTRNHRPLEPVAEFIRSTNKDEILSGSPFVLEIEIDEILSSPRPDWGAWDFCTAVVVESLKGDIERGFKIWLAFAPDSVKPGERYIVAVAPYRSFDNSSVYLTSHNSVFETGQRDEISRALERTSR